MREKEKGARLMTSLEHYDFCKPYIVDGEYILWEGAPEKGFSLTSRDVMLIPFSVIWLGFALFWEYLAVTTSGSLLMMVWGLPFIGVGIYLLFGRFLQTLYLRDKTFYIITNKKLIIRSGNKVKIYRAQDLPPMDIHLHKNGTGTILFSELSYGRNGRRYGSYFVLENIADVAGAQNALGRMER